MKKFTTLVLVTVLIAGLLLSGCAPKEKPVETPSQVPATEEPATPEATKEAQVPEAPAQGVSFEKFLEDVHAKVQAHWPHMDKVWPTYDYTKHNFVVFHIDNDHNVKEAWLLNTEGKRKLEPQDYEKLEVPMSNNYSEIQFEGKPSISMSINDDDLNQDNAVEEFYRTATHELVHFYYQHDMTIAEEGNRSQKFPLEVQPRLYRRMLYERLMDAFENPKEAQNKLANARYWLDKWKTEFPDEYKAIESTDIAEGTARYVENLGYFIRDKLTPEQFKEEAVKTFQRDIVFDSGDEESYEIGYVAALMLDQTNPGWKNSYYKEGKTLQDLLLEKVTPQEDQIDPAIQKKVTEELASINKETLASISTLTDALKDKKIPYLRLTTKDNLTGFSASSMILYENLDVMSNFAAKFNSNGVPVDLKGLAVVNGFDDENSTIDIPLGMKHEIKDGLLTVQSDGLKVQSLRVTEHEEDGRIIYTAPLQ